MAIRDIIQNVRDVVETPLVQPLDMLHVFLITGLVLVSVALWTIVLSHLHMKLPTVE